MWWCFCTCFFGKIRINGKHWCTLREYPLNKGGESLFLKSCWTGSYQPIPTGLNSSSWNNHPTLAFFETFNCLGGYSRCPVVDNVDVWTYIQRTSTYFSLEFLLTTYVFIYVNDDDDKRVWCKNLWWEERYWRWKCCLGVICRDLIVLRLRNGGSIGTL